MSSEFEHGFESLPGGTADFVAMTDLFEAAAAEMYEEELVFTDNFELQDAMTAFEIGEVRMDSGVLAPANPDAPAFDPLAPLLPDEVCWLLDRSFACEMEWHHGMTLSQSVHTLLHVHRLDAINPETIRLYASAYAQYGPPERPIELLTVVLRAGVFGLLKCCDAAWRELSKNRVFEGEDWQGEKCEISLLEGVPFNTAAHMLERALAWVQQTTRISEQHQHAIFIRLALRKALLDLLLTPPSHSGVFMDTIQVARQYLQALRECPAPKPESTSPAQAALDPHVIRNLHAYVPLTPRTLRSQDAIWDAVGEWLDGWEAIGMLTAEASLGTWEVVATLRAWRERRPASAFLRSLTQSTFHSDVPVLGRHSNQWLADAFLRPLDITSTGLQQALIASSHPPDGEEMYKSFGLQGSEPLRKPTSSQDVTHLIVQTLTQHCRAMWMNPSRRRRALMRLLPAWLRLQDSLMHSAVNLVGHGTSPIPPSCIQALPRLAERAFLAVARELVMSGLALELYSTSELPAAYWYAARVLAADAEVLDALVPATVESIEHDELVYQRSFVQSMGSLCQGFFVITSSVLRPQPDWDRLRLNFERRHKWVDRVTNPYERRAWPDFDAFEATWRSLGDNALDDALDAIRAGIDGLRQLADDPRQGAAGTWTEQRRVFIASLASSIAVNSDLSAITWDVAQNPWFPVWRTPSA